MGAQYFAIRHKPSGTWMPVYKGGQRAGSTYIDAPFAGTPRLFHSRLAAGNCLRWWLGGFTSGVSPGKGHPDRRADDMEVVPVTIVEDKGALIETIVAAAVCQGDKVVTGFGRHENILGCMDLSAGSWKTGFLTSTGRFVDRAEALRIALEAGQVSGLQGELYSEDLDVGRDR